MLIVVRDTGRVVTRRRLKGGFGVCASNLFLDQVRLHGHVQFVKIQSAIHL